jgi:uncharacterized protein YdaU (DUF1376 family)
MAKRKTPRKKKNLQPEEKQNLPYIPLYTGDYIKDTRDLSLESKGAWSDMILLMWSTKSKGVLVGTIDDFTRRIGSTSAEQTARILTELALKKVADVSKDDDGVMYTVICRRLVREAKISEARTKAVQTRYKTGTTTDTNDVQQVYNPSSKSVQNPDNENEYEVDNDDDSELYGKCENFFHGNVPADLIELAGKLKPMPDADQWHDYVEMKIQAIGYETMREVSQDYLYGGKMVRGRIDIVAKKDSVYVAVELDYRQPRLKSIRKVEKFYAGMVLLRDPKPVHIIKANVTVPPLTRISTHKPNYEEITAEILSDEIFIGNLQMTHRGKDIKQAWNECFTHWSADDNPPVELSEWKKKLNSWLTRKETPHGTTKTPGRKQQHTAKLAASVAKAYSNVFKGRPDEESGQPPS